MKINVIAGLLPPCLRRSWGGSNAPVGTFRGEIDFELSPDSFDDLANSRSITVAGVQCRIISMIDAYHKATNTLTLTGSMISFDKTYVEGLRKQGWEFNEHALERHMVPVSAQEILR